MINLTVKKLIMFNLILTRENYFTYLFYYKKTINNKLIKKIFVFFIEVEYKLFVDE